jgi:type II secretory pathway pseudopilin PulG
MTGINLQKQQQGFTIVEAVVAITIFLFIIGAVISIFLSIVESQREVLSEQQLLNQMSFAEETMSKALRVAEADPTGDCISDESADTGFVYELTRPDSGTGKYDGIKFINSSDTTESGAGTCTEFFLEQDPSTGNGVLEELKAASDGTMLDANAIPLTSPTFNITGVDFALNGQDATVASGINSLTNQFPIQPRVTINLHVAILESGQTIIQNVQTTISQRNLNVNY